MENIKINITSNGTTTLATAGKYCERNVDIDVLVIGGGGGASLLDSEGSLFMTADEEAFCVDGNDRMVDVKEFPETPLDNVVYRKNEKTTFSDGQLTYINETTSYGIPVQTDHSNGLHYKNVEVYQYVGGEKDPHAWIRTDGSNAVEALVYCSMIGIPKQGYKIVNTAHEWDKNDTDYVYLIRSRNMCMVYLFSWVAVSATRINNPSEASTTQDNTIYYGGGWQSLTALKECENVSADNGKILYGLIVGTLMGEFNDPLIDRVRRYAFYNCYNLTKITMVNAYDIGYEAFSHCSELVSIDIEGRDIDESAFTYCRRLRCLVLRTDTNAFSDTSPKKVLQGSYRFLGEVGEGNEEGLQDGYIYVPLSQIESYKTGSKSSELASQYMPFVETMSELYALDTSKYTIAYLGSFGQECKYEKDRGWRNLR